MPVVNLEQKLAGFSEHWSPKIVAGFNGHDVMVVNPSTGETIQIAASRKAAFAPAKPLKDRLNGAGT